MFDRIFSAAAAAEMARLAEIREQRVKEREIYNTIQEKAFNGGYTITISKTIPEAILERLKKNGFTVERAAERLYTISWYPKEKQNEQN